MQSACRIKDTGPVKLKSRESREGICQEVVRRGSFECII
jgi:hypothetical protein